MWFCVVLQIVVWESLQEKRMNWVLSWQWCSVLNCCLTLKWNLSPQIYTGWLLCNRLYLITVSTASIHLNELSYSLKKVNSSCAFSFLRWYEIQKYECVFTFQWYVLLGIWCFSFNLEKTKSWVHECIAKNLAVIVYCWDWIGRIRNF